MSFQGLMEGPGGAGIASLLGQTAQAGQGVANPMSQFNSLATQIAPSMIQAKAVEKFKKAEAAKILQETLIKQVQQDNGQKVRDYLTSTGGYGPEAAALGAGDATVQQMLDLVNARRQTDAAYRSAEAIYPSPGSTYQSPGPKLGTGPVGTPVPMPQVQGGTPVPLPTGTDGVIQGQAAAQGPSAMPWEKKELLNQIGANQGDLSKSLNNLALVRDARHKNALIQDSEKLEPAVQTLQLMLTPGTAANAALVEAGITGPAQAYVAMSEAIKAAEAGGASEDTLAVLRAQLVLPNFSIDAAQSLADKVHKWGVEAQELELKKQDSQTRKQAADNNSKILGARINQIEQSTQTSAANEDKIRKETTTIGQPDEEKAKARQEKLIKESQDVLDKYEKERRALEQKSAKAKGGVIPNEDESKALDRQIKEVKTKEQQQRKKLKELGVDIPETATSTTTKPVANPKTADLLQNLGNNMKLLRETFGKK